MTVKAVSTYLTDYAWCFHLSLHFVQSVKLPHLVHLPLLLQSAFPTHLPLPVQFPVVQPPHLLLLRFIIPVQLTIPMGLTVTVHQCRSIITYFILTCSSMFSMNAVPFFRYLPVSSRIFFICFWNPSFPDM